MKNYDYWKKSQITDISTFCYWLHQKGVGIYASVFCRLSSELNRVEMNINFTKSLLDKSQSLPLLETYCFCTVSYYYSYYSLSFFGTWTCPQQISGTTGQNFMLHFQNGHHNTAQIQHCTLSDIIKIWYVGR